MKPKKYEVRPDFDRHYVFNQSFIDKINSPTTQSISDTVDKWVDSKNEIFNSNFLNKQLK